MFSGTLNDLVNGLLTLINPLLVLLVALSLLAFFWGLAKFIYKSGDPASHADGKKLMIWGIIALFVLTSFLGIIQFVSNDLGFNFGGIPLLPTGSNLE
jgi:hypothetical protein